VKTALWLAAEHAAFRPLLDVENCSFKSSHCVVVIWSFLIMEKYFIVDENK